jgi:hypothetical protein
MEGYLGEGSDDADENYRDDDIDRGDILGRTHMEDYGNRLEDYVNGHEQDDDDGDVDGDFCYGTIHECIRRRMQANKPTDMEVDGYPLGDYLTGS